MDDERGVCRERCDARMASALSTPHSRGAAGLVVGLPWRGTTTARTLSGDLVAVQTLRLSPSARRLVRRRAQQLVGFEADGLTAVRSVSEGEDGTLVVLTDLAIGPRLSDVATAHGGMSADGVQRLLGELAAGLAQLHAQGLGHGGITADTVVLRPEGAVLTGLLADAVGLAAPRPGGSSGTASRALAPERRVGHAVAPTPASDVWELAAALAHVLATGTRTVVHDLDVDVRELLEAASDVDPGARPSATRIAAVVAARNPGQSERAWGRPAPDVWQIDDAVAEAEREVALLAPTLAGPRRRRVGRTARSALAVGVGLAIALGAGVFAAGPWPSFAAPATAASGAPPGQAAAFAVRDRALETGDVALLARAVQPGGPAWARDVETLAALRRGGVVLDGVRTVVLPAAAESGPGAVRVAQAAHRRTSGGVATVLGPQPPSCLVVTVVPAPSGTRLVEWVACD